MINTEQDAVQNTDFYEGMNEDAVLPNILLEDDQPENLLTLSAVLTSKKHVLHQALSGREALHKVLNHDFAVILLDVQMPDLDGFETASLIRSQQQFKAMPIIFVTAVFNDPGHWTSLKLKKVA